MRIGFRKILRDLWRSKGRTVLAVVSIAVGVFAVGMVSGMSDLVPARMMSSYRETNPAHVTIYLSGIVTNDDLARLARVPGVLDIEGLRNLGARWQPNPNAALRDVVIIIRPDYARSKIQHDPAPQRRVARPGRHRRRAIDSRFVRRAAQWHADAAG